MENTNPVRWLRALESDPSAIGRLVEESGSLVLAAHRIARARCGNPTAREVASVAKEIAARTGFFDVLPSREALAAACGVAV